jgi:hypothetical protein
VDVFSLPPLTPKERQAVQMAEASAPPVDGDPAFLLSSGGEASPSSAAAAAPSSASPPPAVQGGDAGASDSPDGPPANPSAPAPDAGATEAPAATGERKRETGAARTETSPEGDSPEQPRRPPTLYSPGESRENPAPPQEKPR